MSSPLSLPNKETANSIENREPKMDKISNDNLEASDNTCIDDAVAVAHMTNHDKSDHTTDASLFSSASSSTCNHEWIVRSHPINPCSIIVCDKCNMVYG